MRRVYWSKIWDRCKSFRWLALGLLAAVAAPGCGHKTEGTNASVAEPPTVHLIQPQYRKIVRVIGQPSFVEAYERTSIYPKVTGYIKKWNVDIGDKVKKGDVLATLFVPELEEDWETKKRTVKLDQEKVDLAEKIVKVAEADVKAAEARLEEAKAILAKYEADAHRWDSEVKRLKREVANGVVDPQVLLESENQWKATLAAVAAAKATIAKAEAELLSKKATLSEDVVDVSVAKARVAVADSDAKRMEAWVGYLQLIAPYDGIITARNANTWDFVLPSTGDPSADHRAPHLSPSSQAAPIYVVDRTDIVRIFVDVPESDANYVQIGTKAAVQIKGFRDQWIRGTVTRTSWALNVKSRTLRAEIDLPNTNSQILPGMYAYGKVIIERNNVRALPESAIVHSGDQTFYWRHENGHAYRTEVQTGVSDREWIEVTNRQIPAKSATDEPWAPIDGTEQVLTGDLALLAEGGAVRLADAPANKGELASATPGHGASKAEPKKAE
jgi:multidrug efflux pump subunit AcrA (membrane-fusion protein)